MEQRSRRRVRVFSLDGTFEDAIARFTRFALGATLLASLSHLALAIRFGSGNTLRFDGTPFGIVVTLSLLFILWKWPQQLRLVVILSYIVLVLGLTVKLSFMVFFDDTTLLSQLLWMLPWMTISFVLSFILFSGRAATVLSALVLLFWAVISAVYVALHISTTEGQQALLFFSQTDIAECVLIVFMGLFSRLQGLYLLSHKSALHLQEVANTDFLLDLPNRRSIQAILAEELKRAVRTGEKVSIALMDVDRFKHVNDRFGHETGDSILLSVTQTVQDVTHSPSVFGRWGGDEFLLIAPHLTGDVMAKVTEDIRAAVASQRLEVGRVTVSFGIAESRVDDTVLTLMKRADEALYRAKMLGRNRVEWAWEARTRGLFQGSESVNQEEFPVTPHRV